MKTTGVGSVKSLTSSNEPSVSTQKEALSPVEDRGVASDSVKISVPRTKTLQGERAAEPLSAAEALAASIRENKDAASVHGKIEASRVLDLLSED